MQSLKDTDCFNVFMKQVQKLKDQPASIEKNTEEIFVGWEIFLQRYEKGISSLFANMTESLAVRIRGDNQDIVKDSTESYISLDSDVLLYHLVSVKAILFFRLVFFQDRDILGYKAYKTEIKLCSNYKWRDSHVETNPHRHLAATV